MMGGESLAAPGKTENAGADELAGRPASGGACTLSDRFRRVRVDSLLRRRRADVIKITRNVIKPSISNGPNAYVFIVQFSSRTVTDA